MKKGTYTPHKRSIWHLSSANLKPETLKLVVVAYHQKNRYFIACIDNRKNINDVSILLELMTALVVFKIKNHFH